MRESLFPFFSTTLTATTHPEACKPLTSLDSQLVGRIQLQMNPASIEGEINLMTCVIRDSLSIFSTGRTQLKSTVKCSALEYNGSATLWVEITYIQGKRATVHASSVLSLGCKWSCPLHTVKKMVVRKARSYML